MVAPRTGSVVLYSAAVHMAFLVQLAGATPRFGFFSDQASDSLTPMQSFNLEMADLGDSKESALLTPGSVVTLEGGAHHKFCTFDGTKSTGHSTCLADEPGKYGRFEVLGMGNGSIALKVNISS